MASLKRNLIFETIYQIICTCTPLITSPYISRVLGPTKLGIYSYTLSVVSYFTLFAMLGTVNYGTRCIAEAKNDRKRRSKIFWENWTLQLVASSLMIIIYIVYLVTICDENIVIAFFQGIVLVSCMADISWLFTGMEEMKIVVARNLLIKILTIVLILSLIKSKDDLWLYVVIMGGGIFGGHLLLWVKLKEVVDFCHISIKGVERHLKPNLILFVPILAMSVYHVMDKTMLGILSTYEQSGFYYNADKIINIPVGIISGIGTVLLPRISYLISSKRYEKALDLFKYSLEGTMVLSVAIGFGIAAIAKEFVPFFLGDGYAECVPIIYVFAPVLVFKSISIAIRSEFLIPFCMEKYFSTSVLFGAIINYIFNFVLIPYSGAIGATMGTFAAEMIACVIQIMYLKKYIDLKGIIEKIVCYSIFGMIMIAGVRIIATGLLGVEIKIIFEIIFGALIYISLCVIYWKITNSILMAKFISEFKNKMGNRK